MAEHELLIYKNIISGMEEGVLVIGVSGAVQSINEACKRILGVGDDIVGVPFALTFFEYSENDAFNQSILDAVYQNRTIRNAAVDYFDGEDTKKLFITTSYLKNEGQKVGVIAVLNDVTELLELRDAIVAMERIKALNAQLERRNDFIFKTFGRYLSDDIVKSILETEGGLEIGGQRKEVTVMFTDLRGFTAISEMLEPRRLIDMLNHYLGEMVEIISAAGGTVLDFIGDAMVVVFGAPVVIERAPEKAVTTALTMQNKMNEINAFNEANGLPGIEMGIGIHTGDVILGNIGSEKKAKYDVIGRNVNYASRIETFTVGGQVFISEETRRMLDRVEIGQTKEIMPKGVKQAQTIYEVLAIDGISLARKAYEMIRPENPIDIALYTLDGKSVGKEALPVKIVQYSAKRAVLDVALKPDTNVRFELDGLELFGKMISDRTIHLTMGELKIG